MIAQHCSFLIVMLPVLSAKWIGRLEQLLCAGLLGILCIGCSHRPVGAFQAGRVPRVPNYADTAVWAALPQMRDSADVVPDSAYANLQDEAPVDVFYLYPTTYVGKKGQNTWNGDVYDSELNRRTDKSALRNQASVFNGSCKVYAPRYRQAHLESFYTKRHKEDARAALMLAYQDVRNAFQYYLEHYNQGRPLILAGHSQGTLHAQQLIKEFFDPPAPGMPDLVVAYLVGMPIDTSTFSTLELCQRADDTHCFCTWRTVHERYKPGRLYPCGEDYCVTNPVTWDTDKPEETRSSHQGAVLMHFYEGITPEMIDVSASDGLLRISRPRVPGVPTIFIRNYHIADYNLFYADIRQNVADRVLAYQKDKGHVRR